jgi:glutathione peroxidase
MSAAACILAATLVTIGMAAANAAETAKPKGPLDFTLTANDGKPYPLAQLKGKVVLLVNTASKCGLTPQYADLEKLHETYGARGLVVVAVPANEFGAQEPGSDAEIRAFCSTKYQVAFPLMSKIAVKGDAIDPLYRWLTVDSAKPGPIAWNFTKFLIGRDGALIERFEPKVVPSSAEVTAAVETALGK